MKRSLTIIFAILASCSPYVPVQIAVPGPVSHSDGLAWQAGAFGGSGFAGDDHMGGILLSVDRTYRFRFFRFLAGGYLYGGGYYADSFYTYLGGFEVTEAEILLPFDRWEIDAGVGLGAGLEYGSYVSHLVLLDDSLRLVIVPRMSVIGGLAYNLGDLVLGIRGSYGFPTGASVYIRHSNGWFGQLGFDYTNLDFNNVIGFLSIGRMIE